MSKKRFYNNKKRNRKWTEPERGRKISFADKYIAAGNGSDKFDKRRPRVRVRKITRQSLETLARRVIVIVCCFLIIGVGYTVMDLYMERRSMPSAPRTPQQEILLRDVKYDVRANYAQPLSLDGGIMLDAVIDEAQGGGYNALVFDAKRDDGSIGYESALATIGAYGAVSSASSDLEGSVQRLRENDILPIARISCFRDNIVPNIDLNSAVIDGGKPYKDAEGNTFLNPNSDSATEYLRSIIDELKGKGITVFLLDNCDLPDDITNNYYDGFKSISKLLYAEFNNEIKLLSAVDVRLEEKDGDKLKKELEEKVEMTDSKDKVYFIRTENPERVKSLLDKAAITNYIIEQY